MKSPLLNREIFKPVKFPGYPSMLLVLLFIVVTGQISAQGTWTALTNTSPDLSGGGLLLLSDGTVLAKTESGGTDGIGNIWNKFTPDIHGSYVNGTWSSISAMHNTRLYFSAQILKDGRVYVAGGEYGTGKSLGETYDPLTNAWTNNPAPGQTVSDANSEILPDGKVLQALVAGNLKGNVIYNPLTNTYGSGPSCIGIHNESAWVKLPDNSILMVDRNTTNSERYIPSLNQWVADATVPVSLYDPYGLETGGAVLLPDGRAFFIGSLANTALYTPSGNNNPGTWIAGPSVSGHGAPDAAAAMMGNGKVLCALSPVPTSGNHFPTPTSFYEYDPTGNSFTQVNAPGGGLTRNISSYEATMLNLPDGKILYAEQDNDQYYIYTPAGTPLASWKPVINTIAQINCTNLYTITGTKFNGISEGATYGDDWQMATNYPVIRLTSGNNVYYARTFNWNSTGVQRGTLPDTAQFTLPANLPAGTYSLVVTANGISSDPVSFTPGSQPSATITPGGPTTFCSGGSVALNANTGTGLTYQWKKNGTNISGATNSAYTASATGSYSVAVTNSCGSATSSATTVTVNPLPSATVTPAGPTTFCSGGSVVLNAPTGANLSYQWKKGGTLLSGATLASYTATTGGNYRVIVTNTVTSCAKTTTSATVVTVDKPAATITPQGPTTFCAGGSVVLAANTGTGLTYKWKKGNAYIPGATLSNYTATTAGTYKVEVTNSNGCSKLSSGVTVTVPCREGDMVSENNFEVNVYPNPNSGVFTVEFLNKPGAPLQIEITDEMGRVVKRIETTEQAVSFNESNFARGVYSLIVRNHEKMIVKKISIMK